MKRSITLQLILFVVTVEDIANFKTRSDSYIGKTQESESFGLKKRRRVENNEYAETGIERENYKPVSNSNKRTNVEPEDGHFSATDNKEGRRRGAANRRRTMQFGEVTRSVLTYRQQIYYGIPLEFGSDREPALFTIRVKRPPLGADLRARNRAGKQRIRKRTDIGVPGVDFPLYGEVPNTNFSCLRRHGLFVDTATRCQVFYTCQGDDKRSSAHICPNGTLFNQRFKVCDWWYNVNCPVNPTEKLYWYMGLTRRQTEPSLVPQLPISRTKLPMFLTARLRSESDRKSSELFDGPLRISEPIRGHGPLPPHLIAKLKRDKI
ncbi:Uncharacterised protein g1327 [Pycnogonum litorale]